MVVIACGIADSLSVRGRLAALPATGAAFYGKGIALVRRVVVSARLGGWAAKRPAARPIRV
jgi:hypothetical protein